MNIIHVPETIYYRNEGKSIFLAGPTPRKPEVPSWRPEAIRLFQEAGFEGNLFSPEGREETWCKDYAQQCEWEFMALHHSDLIMFWVPRSLPDMPAFTTNDEFGYWRAKAPDRIIFGCPENAVKMGYQLYQCQRENIPVAHTLEETVKLTLSHGEI
jgi:hypothetical protein